MKFKPFGFIEMMMLNLYVIYRNWKRWWYTPPKRTNFFFTRIRRLFQYFFKCKHIYIHEELYVHGESHGKNRAERVCKWCGNKQRLVYHSFGSTRYEWKDKFRF